MAGKRPSWLVQKAPRPEDFSQMAALLHRHGLNTVCEEARCPNQGECFAQRTATFMILGKVCTRNCRFCSVCKGLPSPLDPEEPNRVAAAAKALELRHVVITSVTRDDLPDGGAQHFAATAEAIRGEIPEAIMEVLIPDLGGKEEALQILLAARPHILGHNLETVSRLYPSIRPEANYERSLGILKQAKERSDGIFTKSGLMLGLGESIEEVEGVLQDLRRVGCDLLALGQYLQPTPQQVPVRTFLPPDLFSRLKERAEELGFAHVASAPFVRSSYHSEEAYQHIRACP